MCVSVKFVFVFFAERAEGARPPPPPAPAFEFGVAEKESMGYPFIRLAFLLFILRLSARVGIPT